MSAVAVPEQTDLVVSRLSGALTLLSEAKSAQDAKKVADLARAAEIFAQRQKLGDEAESWARSIKLQAERLLGEFLAKAPKDKGGRPAKTGTRPEPVSTLADLGITKKESARAQKLAAMPAEEFERLKGEPKSERPKPKKTAHERRAENYNRSMLDEALRITGAVESLVEGVLNPERYFSELTAETLKLIRREARKSIRLLEKLEPKITEKGTARARRAEDGRTG